MLVSSSSWNSTAKSEGRSVRRRVSIQRAQIVALVENAPALSSTPKAEIAMTEVPTSKNILRPLRRRSFFRLAAASGLTTFSSKRSLAEDTFDTRSTPEVCIYTEQFQSLPIPEVCKIFKRIGAQGLDVTVRPGGHIKPEDARVQLLIAARVAREHELKIMMLTTGITAADRNAENILAACQEIGVDRIKLGYFRPGSFGTLRKSLDTTRRQLNQISQLAAKYGVLPCVHVHSGETIPSNAFLLYEVIRDIEPSRIGAYLDSHHMTITGGAGGWRQAIDLLTPWISLVALKNHRWHTHGRDETGQQKWRTSYCRLEDGVAPIPDFVRTVHQAGYQGFYTLHTEYRLPVQECTRLTTDDFAFLKRVLTRL